MRKEITVPAAGVSEPFSFTGRSILIEQAAGYSSFEDVPVLSFDVPGGQYPALTRSKYQNPQGKFNKMIVTGTEAAAGDSIVLVSVDACVDDFINFDSLGTGRATLKPTFSKTVSDVVVQLTQTEYADAAGNLPSRMYVTPRGGDVAYSFDTEPTQGAGGLGHVIQENQVQPIEGINFITDFKAINLVAAAGIELSFTMEY